MDNKAEQLIVIAGSSGRYQFILSLFLYFTSMLIISMVICFPYFEISPQVNYQDLNGYIHTNQKLSYKICENSRSIVILSNTQWSWTTILNIQCNKFMVALLNSSIYIGMLIGSLVLKYLCNSVGRKTTFIILAFVLNLCRLCYNFPLYYSSLFILNVLTSITEIGGAYCCTLLCMESADYKTRTLMKCLQGTFYCLCSNSILLYLRFTKDWLNCLNIVSVLNMILLVIAYFCTLESPLYYLHNNKLDLFFETLRQISKVNDTTIVYNSLVLQNYELVKSTEMQENEENTNLLPEPHFYIEKKKECYEIIKELYLESKKEKIEESNWVFGVLFTDRKVCMNFIMLTYLSAFKCVISDGMNLMVKALSGDIYLNGIFFNTLEIFLNIPFFFMMNSKFFGRIRTMFLLILLSSAVLGAAMFIDPKSAVYTSLIYTVKFLGCWISTVLGVYIIEVYPTNARAAGISLNLAISKVELIFIPFLVEFIGDSIIYVYFGMSLFALVPYFFLPETYEVPISN